MKKISISDFIKTKYRDFWKESNINRNTFIDHEQLMTIERRIIWSAFKIGIRVGEDHKTTELSGEVMKYHIAGDQSIQDSIKGLAAEYKRQPAVRILKGTGNMGTHPGDPGSAARYTSVSGTPLLAAIIKDLPYVDMTSDETGVQQPDFVSCPLPMGLINGRTTAIGTGRAAYFDERDAKEVIDWIEKLANGEEVELPDPISTTGCHVYKNELNGYTYYEAKMHREGRKDIITALPPDVTTDNVIETIKKKLPKIADKIIDGSGKGRSIWIMLPAGAIERENFSKYNLLKARKEAPYIWDRSLDTIRMSSHEEIALAWFNKRCEIVSLRIKDQLSKIESSIKKVDIIKTYVEKGMNNWESQDILKYFGEEDGEMVLSQPARVFLPENLSKNELQKEKQIKDLKEKEYQLKRVKEVVIEEARDIIRKQENFSWEY